MPLRVSGTSLVDDALGESLHDGGLADAGLADQHRVVLGAPLQDLDHAADLVVAPDHRVELALTRAVGEVERVLFQRLTLALGLGVLDFLAPAHRLDRLLDGLARPAMLLQQPAGLALVLGQGEQEHLGGDELVTPLLRFLVRDVEEVAKVARQRDLAGSAFHLRQPLDALSEGVTQRRDVDARSLQQRRGAAVLLLQQRQQEVRGLDERVVLAERQALGVGEGLLELGRELVEAHAGTPFFRPFQYEGFPPGFKQKQLRSHAKSK